MSDDSSSNVMIGRLDSGHVIVVTGRGTCRESAAVARFATESLRAGTGTVTIDLSACNHLDSTFLGCLVQLHREFNVSQPPRMVVVASPEQVQKLLAPSRLNTLLSVTPKSPVLRDTLMMLSDEDIDQFEMGTHVMECHRVLAELGGPQAAAFAAVADQLGRELGGRQPVPGKRGE
jgi:anti-anti-sigma regulatory factor